MSHENLARAAAQYFIKQARPTVKSILSRVGGGGPPPRAAVRLPVGPIPPNTAIPTPHSPGHFSTHKDMYKLLGGTAAVGGGSYGLYKAFGGGTAPPAPPAPPAPSAPAPPPADKAETNPWYSMQNLAPMGIGGGVGALLAQLAVENDDNETNKWIKTLAGAGLGAGAGYGGKYLYDMFTSPSAPAAPTAPTTT